jgi:hypothetical protein
LACLLVSLIFWQIVKQEILKCTSVHELTHVKRQNIMNMWYHRFILLGAVVLPASLAKREQYNYTCRKENHKKKSLQILIIGWRPHDVFNYNCLHYLLLEKKGQASWFSKFVIKNRRLPLQLEKWDMKRVTQWKKMYWFFL